MVLFKHWKHGICFTHLIKQAIKVKRWMEGPFKYVAANHMAPGYCKQIPNWMSLSIYITSLTVYKPSTDTSCYIKLCCTSIYKRCRIYTASTSNRLSLHSRLYYLSVQQIMDVQHYNDQNASSSTIWAICTLFSIKNPEICPCKLKKY